MKKPKRVNVPGKVWVAVYSFVMLLASTAELTNNFEFLSESFVIVTSIICLLLVCAGVSVYWHSVFTNTRSRKKELFFGISLIPIASLYIAIVPIEAIFPFILASAFWIVGTQVIWNIIKGGELSPY